MIDWEQLSRNPEAIQLLEANQDVIDWDQLVQNDSIFIYDYPRTKANCAIFKDELMVFIRND